MRGVKNGIKGFLRNVILDENGENAWNRKLTNFWRTVSKNVVEKREKCQLFTLLLPLKPRNSLLRSSVSIGIYILSSLIFIFASLSLFYAFAFYLEAYPTCHIFSLPVHCELKSKMKLYRHSLFFMGSTLSFCWNLKYEQNPENTGLKMARRVFLEPAAPPSFKVVKPLKLAGF